MTINKITNVIFYTCFALILVSCATSPTSTTGKQQISEVALTTKSFNPSQKENVQFNYTLATADQVTVNIYDADGGLVRSLIEATEQEAGKHQIKWDGLDLEGKPVPDEAYTFTIETSSGAVYDPSTFSGGIVGDITNADANSGTLIYTLPKASRVLIRLGLHSGPMLNTLVDWKPRIAGSITEYWNGQDEDKLITLFGKPKFSALITYVSLPDATVISYGNDKETYRHYKLGRAKDGPQKVKRSRIADAEGRLRPDNLVPPAWARVPHVNVTLPKHPSVDLPEVKDIVQVRVDVDASDRDYLLRDQFEVIFFVDNVFFAEAERGYLPFNWRWELNQIPPGEHILTVNISSFKGQVGVKSLKVKVLGD